MTSGMRIALLFTSYLLVLALGLGGGYYFGLRVGQGGALVADMAELTHLSAYIETQMSDGTDATREEAIRGFLASLEERKKHQSPWFTEKVYATDSALSYARLSALARRRGATQEAQKLLERAASFCPQIGWQECSAEKIVDVVHRLDKRGLFGPATTR